MSHPQAPLAEVFSFPLHTRKEYVPLHLHPADLAVEREDILNLHFPTENEGDCYIISSQGAPFEQIEAENNSMMEADAGTTGLSSGAARGGCKTGRLSVNPNKNRLPGQATQ